MTEGLGRAFIDGQRRHSRSGHKAGPDVATPPDVYKVTLSRLAFFLQAEDGIRDLTVTGVQTCALPISKTSRSPITIRETREPEAAVSGALGEREVFAVRISKAHVALSEGVVIVRAAAVKIGRASCRERV